MQFTQYLHHSISCMVAVSMPYDVCPAADKPEYNISGLFSASSAPKFLRFAQEDKTFPKPSELQGRT
jgi:hypothetical protein